MDVEVIDRKSDSIMNHIASSIQEVRNKKKTLVLTIDSLKSLMREVEYEEKSADKATKEAALSTLHTQEKINKRNQALLQAEETKNMLIRKANIEKDVLAIKMELNHRRVVSMLDVEDRSLDALTEIREALNKRLTSAVRKKEVAYETKQENESALANQELKIKKVVEEFNSLKQEILENSKLQELIKDMDNLTDMLNGEITDQHQDVNLLKV